MKTEKLVFGFIGFCFFLLTMIVVPQGVQAHCDTLAGPVVEDARTALATGDVTPVLKWVRESDEEQIRSAFAQTLAVRKQGPDARELADHYFFETLVRIHRAGEGAPYTGLKSPDAVDPAVKLADRALATGDVDKLVSILTGAMADGIRARFQDTLASREHMHDSVESGRAYVRDYVLFTHYIEGLHLQVQGGALHHHAGE